MVDGLEEAAPAAPVPPVRRRWSSQPRRRLALSVLGLVVVVGAVLALRWRDTSTPARAGQRAEMPTSTAIEAKYGIRFTLVDVTAGGGMIEIRYQVLDSGKTTAIHDVDITPVIIAADGSKYGDPGMVGHSHVGTAKAAGTTDYILLANARGGVKAGSRVTIKIGDLQLSGVQVL